MSDPNDPVDICADFADLIKSKGATSPEVKAFREYYANEPELSKLLEVSMRLSGYRENAKIEADVSVVKHGWWQCLCIWFWSKAFGITKAKWCQNKLIAASLKGIKTSCDICNRHDCKCPDYSRGEG